MYCTNCGSKFEGGFCPVCGVPAFDSNQKKVDPDDEVTIMPDMAANEDYAKKNDGASLNGETPAGYARNNNIPESSDDEETVVLPNNNYAEFVSTERKYANNAGTQPEISGYGNGNYYPPQPEYPGSSEPAQKDSAVWASPAEKEKSGKGKKIAVALCAVILVTAGAVAAFFLRPIPVKNIEFAQKQAVLDVEGTYKINYSVSPENNKEEGLKWSSSDENVATVANGVITAKGKGECVITAESEKGVTESFNVTVEINPKDIRLSNTVSNITVGKTLQLTAEVLPADANNKTVKWTASDSGVATVDQNGLVKAVTPGSCVITVSAANGVEAKCSVTVTKPLEDTLILGSWEVYYLEASADYGSSYQPYQYDEGDGAVFKEDNTCTITWWGNAYTGKWKFVKVDEDGDYEYKIDYDDGATGRVWVYQNKLSDFYGDLQINDRLPMREGGYLPVRIYCEKDSSVYA